MGLLSIITVGEKRCHEEVWGGRGGRFWPPSNSIKLEGGQNLPTLPPQTSLWHLFSLSYNLFSFGSDGIFSYN